MKVSFRRSAMVAGVLSALVSVSGCGNVSRNVAGDGKGAGELVWPKIDDVTPMHAGGTWPDLGSLRLVHAGQGKNQIAALVGYPHFSEGVLAVHEWNYLFHFRTGNNSDLVCQYKVLFDGHMIAQSFYWKPERCADVLDQPTEARAEKHFNLSADALFAFDKSSIDDITPTGREQLDELAGQILASGDKRAMVHVIGYADRLGGHDYNDGLSRQRAYAVMAHLIGRGVPSSAIMAEGRGSAVPLTTGCQSDNRVQLIACLAPDRRVEVIVTGRY